MIYVDSLSKTVGGGLRVGWIAARGPVFERLAMLKLESDFHSATLPQHIAARYLAAAATTATSRRPRRSTASAATRCWRRSSATCPASPRDGRTGPPRLADARAAGGRAALYGEAIRHGVSYVPGGAVTVERRAQTSMRLSYSLLDPAEVEEGIKRLARALREVRRRARGLGRDDLLLGEQLVPGARQLRRWARAQALQDSRRTPARWVRRAAANSSRPSSVIRARQPRPSSGESARPPVRAAGAGRPAGSARCG